MANLRNISKTCISCTRCTSIELKNIKISSKKTKTHLPNQKRIRFISKMWLDHQLDQIALLRIQFQKKARCFLFF